MEKIELILTAVLQSLEQLNCTTLVNAFYAALALKKQAGLEITPEVEKIVLGEVFSKMLVIQNQLQQATQKAGHQHEPFRPT